MWVQVRKHAADGVVDQRFVLDGLNVANFDRVENFGKGPQFFDRQAGACLFFGHGRKLQTDQDAAQ